MDESDQPVPVAQLLAAGRAALARGAWRQARGEFERALAQPGSDGDGVAAWEGLSWAAWWLEDVPACAAARERAFRCYRDQGDQRGAARMALWLGDDQIEFHRAEAVADGWFQRAARLLADLEPGPEHGWLAVFQAQAALAGHDPAEAIRQSGRARELGQRYGVVDLEMFGLATEGMALVDQGAVADGMRCLDEATAAALAGEFENLAPAAWTCCRLISACELVRDYQRGAQWCRQVAEFSARLDTRFLTGVCRAHYAAILTWHGSWPEAERELFAAIDDLAANRPVWLPEAVVRLGELRRRQGRLDEAEELYGRVAGHPLAQRGLAELSLDRGDPATARDLLERQLRRIPAGSRASRADVLELLVRVELALGHREAAAARLDELRAVAGAASAPPLRAAVRCTEGLLAAATARYEEAQDHLEEAVDLFRAAHAPVEIGRARLELAQVLLATGRREAGTREARAARDGLAEVGEAVLRARVEAVLAREEAVLVREEAAPPPGPLTTRQREVLRLVAEGMTDQEIATRLTLSAHTVHRHIANIYARLGCSSRTTAVVRASRLGLL